MNLHIFQLPYDSARRDWRMGCGPAHLMDNGLPESLQAAGHVYETTVIESFDPFPTEIKTGFDLYGRLSEGVQSAVEAGAFPLVLSGNCGASLGTLSGMGLAAPGIIWFDAHGDFNTPETTSSGFLDGMVLAVAAGQCYRKLAAAIPGFQTVPGRNILHIGGNDIEPDEGQLMHSAHVQVVPAAAIHASGPAVALSGALDDLQSAAQEIYLHLDLDVLDPAVTPANFFPTNGGLEVETVKTIIKEIRRRFTIRAIGVASYDPAVDPQNVTVKAGIELILAALDSPAVPASPGQAPA